MANSRELRAQRATLIEDARALMVEAGYPDGRDVRTGAPLVINYDYYALPTPERKSEIDWVVKQFGKLVVGHQSPMV